MIPLVLSSQIQRGIEDFLKTTFPVSTPFFHGVMERFFGGDGGIGKIGVKSLTLTFDQGFIDCAPGINGTDTIMITLSETYMRCVR